jgi:hypothetical protein
VIHSKVTGWVRGDVVRITAAEHPNAVCVLTTDATVNEPHTWFLIDETCAMWRSTEWVEAHQPVLLVRHGAGLGVVDKAA